MKHRSSTAAGWRAAPAALDRLPDEDFDRYLLIDDSDEDMPEIRIVLRDHALQIEEAQP
jgi:hypothetical protein